MYCDFDNSVFGPNYHIPGEKCNNDVKYFYCAKYHNSNKKPIIYRCENHKMHNKNYSNFFNNYYIMFETEKQAKTWLKIQLLK